MKKRKLLLAALGGKQSPPVGTINMTFAGISMAAVGSVRLAKGTISMALGRIGMAAQGQTYVAKGTMAMAFTKASQSAAGRFDDTDALAWKAAVISAGGTVSNTQMGFVNTLIGSLKTTSVWPTLDRLYLYASENIQQSLICLKTRTAGININSNTFLASQGYTIVSSGLLDLNFVASNGGFNYAQNSAEFSFYTRTNKSSSTSVEMGSSDNAFDFGVSNSIKWSDGNNYVALNDANTDAGAAAPTVVSGMWTTTRSNGTTITVYRNGSSIRSASTVSVSVPTHTMTIGGALSKAGTPSFFSVGSQFSIGAVGSGYSAQNALDFYNACQAYMTSLGTQV